MLCYFVAVSYTIKASEIQEKKVVNPKQLIIKCYAQQEGECWVALCLDFNLAAQGDDFEEVKTKLEEMIAEYVYDALAGVDKPYAAQLLSRRAPLSSWLKYYIIRFKVALLHNPARVFDETMPLIPA
jgi:predicted RNase H-like HicB family nuclease